MYIPCYTVSCNKIVTNFSNKYPVIELFKTWLKKNRIKALTGFLIGIEAIKNLFERAYK
jgi:hypothetical protein